MQKRTRGRGRGIHSISTGIVRSTQDPSVSPSRDTISLTRSVDEVITHLTTSQPIEDLVDKPKEAPPSAETPAHEPPAVESNLSNTANSLYRKRSLTPVSDDVVKICREGLDSPDWPSTPARSSSPAPPNLNERNKGGWAATIRDSPYVLPNINWGNFF